MIPILMFAACNQPAEKIPAIDLSDMDQTVSPGEDFYKYANGGWQMKNPLKPEYARFGSFDKLAEDNRDRLNELFNSLSDLKAEKGSVEQKIADLYLQGLDSIRLNQEGNTPIIKYIRDIYAIEDKVALAEKLAQLHMTGGDGFFDIGVDADLMDSRMQILYVGQSGLGIGNRDYYLDEENKEIKKGYQDMLVKLFSLTGIKDPDKAAQNALDVETRLAEVSWTNVRNRDIAAQYNPMSTNQLCSSYSGFDFRTYFQAAGIEPQEKIIVTQPSFFEGFSNLFRNTDIAILKDYLAGLFIKNASPFIGDEYYAAYFDFFSRQMTGVSEQQPRWKRATNIPNAYLSEAVGKMYVDKYFPESSKEKVLKIVGDLKDALGQHIDALDWMSEETKTYAREKLAAFTVKIGYPDKWKDYGNLEIDAAKSYFENVRASRIWAIQDNISKVGKKTDPAEWGMSPQTVNAYYNPTQNEICFPAAILQPPFFNPDADDAVNYGAIGVVIGHEMTHGFDDQGRLFDKNGDMKSWWTEADDKAFSERAAKLASQFDKVEIMPGLMADGKLTLGENIADQGGLRIAYTAFLNSIAGKHPAPVDGLEAEQRFYIGFAHLWAGNITDEEMARRTKSDVHSLSRNRVNATLRNIDTFYDAFSIKEEDAMYLPAEERVIIW